MANKLTIIICCYNGEKRIEKVLDRIIHQNKIEEYVEEVIVVNNCSTDDTGAIVQRYEQLVLSVPIRQVYENETGLSNARRKGVEQCTTDWIAFLDDDNLIEPNWVYSIIKYIEDNPNVGALNGGVIPYTVFDRSAKEETNLKASLKVLACTHYELRELQGNNRSPFRNPIGAGLVIRTAPLKELCRNGWLNSTGRTKDNLVSGEDGEMSLYVKAKGYEFGFCPQAIILHEMNAERLKTEYLRELWYQAGRGVAVAGRGYSKIARTAYKVLIYIRLAWYLWSDKNKHNFYKKYIEGYCDEARKY